jgi:hypothetical protein
MKEGNPPTGYTLGYDLKLSIVLSLLLFGAIIGYYYLAHGLTEAVLLRDKILLFNPLPDTLNLFVQIFLTILGVILTILTILYAFEDPLEKSRVFKVLKAHKLSYQLYQRFTDTSIALFYIMLFLLVFFFFRINWIADKNIQIVAFYLIMVSIVLGLIRTYRCFWLFKRLIEVMHSLEQEKA